MNGSYAQIWSTLLLQIFKNEIDEMNPECLSPPCDLIIRWKGNPNEDKPTVLKRQVNLVGAEEPGNSFILFVDPDDVAQEKSKGVLSVVFHWNLHFFGIASYRH